MSPANPRNWRFTWEAQSHSPTLRLFLFDSETKPAIHCKNLDVHLDFPKFQLLVHWAGEEDFKQVSIRVPIPRVLIDPEAPFHVKALDDHIEVKFALLLPVDHQIVLRFDSVLNLSDEKNMEGDDVKPLSMDSDIKSLSSADEVHFYCRSCSTRLTKSPLGHFVEMPSVDWQDVADNWFGGCCCSFGGISEKLVARYANLYNCAQGMCLLNSATVTLHKDDLMGFEIPNLGGSQNDEPGSDTAGNYELSVDMVNFASDHGVLASCDGLDAEFQNSDRKLGFVDYVNGNVIVGSKCEANEKDSSGNESCCSSTISNLSETVVSPLGCCGHATSKFQNDADETATTNQSIIRNIELTSSQKYFLNGFLGNVFMARSSNLSMDINWVEFGCPQCSSLLGAYPCGNGEIPVGGGVQLFKCYISTSVGGSADLFREYTLEKMFTNQLLENAKDELSFRTVVRDLTTKSTMLQIVLLNPNSWCCSGDCLGTENMQSFSQIALYPVIKVLFSDCSNGAEFQMRILGGKVTNEVAEEVFMSSHQVEELIQCLGSAKVLLPPSCATIQGFQLSSLER